MGETEGPFEEFGLPGYLQKGLAGYGIQSASLIQRLSWAANARRANIIGQSKNGTGKTLAYLGVTLSNIRLSAERPRPIQAIVLSPSRELALQTHDLIVRLSAYASPPLSSVVVVGGQPLAADIASVALFPDVVVGSLGRVVHLVKEEIISLQSLRVLVVDEADQMFSEKSFKFDLHGLIGLMPSNCQLLVYSATYTHDLLDYLHKLVKTPVVIRALDDPSDAGTSTQTGVEPKEGGVEDIQLQNIRQFYVAVRSPDPSAYFEEKLKLLTRILASAKYKQCIVFFNQKFRGVEIANSLR